MVKILFEDSSIVVCIKESGLLSQEGKEGETTMVSLLKEMTGREIYPVHRLDKEVGGIMVYAKNSKAAAFLSKEIKEGRMEKEYLAVIHGKPEKNEGELEDFLFFDKGRNKSFVVKKERRGVKKAKLRYKCVKQENEKTVVAVNLITGRTHQIRVQFASRKMPLYGDRRYGGKDNEKSIALWSCHLEFRNPSTNEIMKFEEMPEREIFK